jgi:hypothetical protein
MEKIFFRFFLLLLPIFVFLTRPIAAATDDGEIAAGERLEIDGVTYRIVKQIAAGNSGQVRFVVCFFGEYFLEVI